jgi:hypothetical protein
VQNSLIPLSGMSILRLIKDKSAVDAVTSSKTIRQDVRVLNLRLQLMLGVRGSSASLGSLRR